MDHLVPLPEVERLSPACLRILGGNPGKFTLQGTNTYLVGTGKRRLLIDTAEGKPSWQQALQRTLEAEQATLAAALITHWHPDHTGGVDQVRALVPGVAVYQNQTQGGEGAGDLGEANEAKVRKVGPDNILDIVDGQTFSVDGATLTAVYTPGHAADHMVFVLREEDALFAGDNVLGQGTAVFEDLAVYLQSLARMQTLFGGVLYPAHGPVVAKGPAKIQEYIRHRQQREDQSIYADVRRDLYPAAERGIRQILDKIEAEGKAVRQGQTWRYNKRSPL